MEQPGIVLTPEQMQAARKNFARSGGEAVRDKYGNQYYRDLRNKRKDRQKPQTI